MKENRKKIPKFLRIFVWVFMVFWVISLALYIIANIYPRSWDIYKNEELGLSFKYPKDWVVQTFPSTIQKYKYDEKFLFLVSNVPFDFPGSETPKELARIIVSRLPKSSVPGGIQTLADENRNIHGEFEPPQENFEINGRAAIRNILTKHSQDSNRILFYWINSDEYIYCVAGIVTIDKPVWLAEFGEYVVRKTVNSLEIFK